MRGPDQVARRAISGHAATPQTNEMKLRRLINPSSRRERENLSGDAKGKGTRRR
jgi:hypothetical protein